MEKIALEEHFRVPELPEYSASSQYISDKAIAGKIDDYLSDFDDLRLKTMDEAGIGKSILSHTVPGIESAFDPEQAVIDARKINDFLAEQIQRRPDRFGGFATLPTQSPREAADELERCVRQLGFHGALINGHTHGHYLDEDPYRVLWERTADLGTPIYIHPTNAFQLPQNYQDHPELTGALWGWAPETATHALRLIYAGVFDRFPAAQVILGHGGESLPYFLWRFDSRFKIMKLASAPKKLPSAYIRENIFITTSGLFSTPPMRCAIDEIGEDRVLFSVDYPYESSKDAGEWFDSVDLPEHTLAKIAHGNAQRLLQLKDKAA